MLGSGHIWALFAGGKGLTWFDPASLICCPCGTSAKSPGVWESRCLFTAHPGSVLPKQSQGSLLPRSWSGFVHFCAIWCFQGLWLMPCSPLFLGKIEENVQGFTKGVICWTDIFLSSGSLSFNNIPIIFVCWGFLLLSQPPAYLHIRQRWGLLIWRCTVPSRPHSILSTLWTQSNMLLLMHHHLYLWRHSLLNWCSLGPLIFH